VAATTTAGATVTVPEAKLSAQRGRAAFCDLERWLLSTSSMRLSLSGVESEAELRGQELLRLQLQAHLDRRGTGDCGAALRVEWGDGRIVQYTHKRLRTRSVVTLFGPVSVTRMGYGRPGCGAVYPLDAELQLPARRFSYEVQRRVVKAAVLGPFDEALDVLSDTGGILMSKRTAEQIVLEASTDFDQFYAERTKADYAGEGPILVAAIDSKGIPLVKPEGAIRTVRARKGEKQQKKRMSTVAAVFSQQPEPRTPEDIVNRLFTVADLEPRRQPRASRPRNKRVWASLVSAKDLFIGDVRQEMLRRDPRRRKSWVVVTDGERGLQRRVCEHFQDVPLILDLLHVLEKLWKAAYAVHDEGSVEAQIFVRDRALRILRGQVGQVVKGLRQMVTKRKLQGAKRHAMLSAAAYFHRNRCRMRYDVYLKNGWPIASGAVEGACKNLIKDRMERSGMRWTPVMAEAMLRLRATYLSGDFEDYWRFHILEDQRRLYPVKIRSVDEK